ncbi:MAG TPA: NAD-binding protein [Ktedonobacterales bacterium]|jgi:Trk K+ transport system NAD-binding subunit
MERNPGTAATPVRQRPFTIRQRRGFWRLLRANLYDLALLLRQSWFTLTLFGVVMVVGAGYEFQHGHPAVTSALYNTLQLLIFQSSEPFPGDVVGQLLFFLLPLLGLLVIVQSALNFGRRVLDKGSRQEAWQVSLATTFSNHVIVCGLGRIGLRVVTRLIEAGYEVVVVEQSFQSRYVARALGMHVPVIVGDASEALALRQAGLTRARAVIADINNDQLNIEIALAARSLRPGIRVILRAFNEDLDRNLEKIFGPDSAFSHSALAAPTLAAAAISREISYALPISNDLIGVVKLTIAKGSQLSGSVRDFEASSGVLVLDQRSSAGRRQDVRPDSVVHTGDHVTFIGALPALEATRLRNVVGADPLPPQHPTSDHNIVIVCGIGKVGYRVVERLAGLRTPPEIVAISLPGDDSAFLRRVSSLPGVTIVPGDARDPAILSQAGLDHAYSVVAATSDDLTNLQIGLAARGIRPDVHLVVRVFSDALADELNLAFAIRTTYSTSNLASPTLAAAAVLHGLDDGGVNRAFTATGRIFSSDEFTALPKGLLNGLTVEQIRARHRLLILSLDRDGGPILLPPPATTIHASDTGTLVAPLEAIEALIPHHAPLR